MCKALMLPLLAGLTLLAPGMAQAGACRGANAAYSLPGAEGFKLVLTPRAEALAWSDLDVVLTTPQQVFRFSLTASNGYSYTYAVQEEPDPGEPAESGDDASQRIYFFNSGLDLLDLPQGKSPAPDLIFMPDFGGALWYENEPRQFMPIAMWRLGPCTP